MATVQKQETDGHAATSNVQTIQTLARRVEELEACGHVTAPSSRDENALNEALLETMNGVKTAVEGLVAQHSQFMQYAAVHGLVPAGPFLSRFHGDHPQQKRSLAEYVANIFFCQRRVPQRCFIQASSAALHLTQALDGIPTVPDRCLIYTNSAVAHLAMLYGHSTGKHIVWPFCGYTFDPVCAGWQIPAEDDKSFEELRRLFQREENPLKMAFLFPLFVSPKDGIFYERADAALFANTLAIADEVIILATGDRVIPDRESLPTEPSHKKYFPALQQIVAENPQKVTIVVSWPTESLPEVAVSLASTFGSVHWETPDGWNTVSPSPQVPGE